MHPYCTNIWTSDFKWICIPQQSFLGRMHYFCVLQTHFWTQHFVLKTKRWVLRKKSPIKNLFIACKLMRDIIILCSDGKNWTLSREIKNVHFIIPYKMRPSEMKKKQIKTYCRNRSKFHQICIYYFEPNLKGFCKKKINFAHQFESWSQTSWYCVKKKQNYIFCRSEKSIV